MSRPPADFDEAMFLRFFRTLNERQARLCAAERALALGRGGITRLARPTGQSPRTNRKGIAELRAAAELEGGRIKARLEYGRGPDRVWAYGALRERDGQAVTLTAPTAPPWAIPTTTCASRPRPRRPSTSTPSWSSTCS